MSARAPSTTATEALRQLIITAQIPPGALLNQSALAKTLGTSRVPVRDALIRLAAQHLVEFREGVALVAPLSTLDLEEIYELREAVEPAATRIALANVGRAEILQMERLLEVMGEFEGLGTWLTANRQFHRLVYAQSNRVQTIGLIDGLAERTDRYLFHYVPELDDGLQLFDEQHRLILDAARTGAGPEIEDLTKLHLVTAHRLILSHMLEHAGPSQEAEPEIPANSTVDEREPSRSM
jgi:DNA-binding GntR family transcriptional regulator